jgi:hypothetical protein
VQNLFVFPIGRRRKSNSGEKQQARRRREIHERSRDAHQSHFRIHVHLCLSVVKASIETLSGFSSCGNDPADRGNFLNVFGDFL